MRLEQNAWRMSLGVSNNGLNPYRQHAFLSVYGCKAVLPLEIQILSLRVALTAKMTQGDNERLCKRLQAQQHIELYQARISKAFYKKVKERLFQKGDLVLAVR